MIERIDLKVGLLSLIVLVGCDARTRVGQSIDGVYESRAADSFEIARISLSAEGFAELSMHGKSEFAEWSTVMIGGRPYQVLNIFSKQKAMALVVTNGVLQIAAYDEDIKEVEDDILNDGGLDPELARLRFEKTGTPIPQDMIGQAKASRNHFVALAKARSERKIQEQLEQKLERQYQERRKFFRAFVGKVENAPETILNVELKYPTRAEVDEVRRADYAYSAEMQGLACAFGDVANGRFKEETLLKFIDKCDWDKDRGFPLVSYALTRREIGPDSRRQFAPRFVPLYGTMDSFWFASFLDHDNTPTEVIIEALATKKLDAELTRKLTTRLATRSGL